MRRACSFEYTAVVTSVSVQIDRCRGTYICACGRLSSCRNSRLLTGSGKYDSVTSPGARGPRCAGRTTPLLLVCIAVFLRRPGRARASQASASHARGRQGLRHSRVRHAIARDEPDSACGDPENLPKPGGISRKSAQAGCGAASSIGDGGTVGLSKTSPSCRANDGLAPPATDFGANARR